MLLALDRAGSLTSLHFEVSLSLSLSPSCCCLTFCSFPMNSRTRCSGADNEVASRGRSTALIGGSNASAFVRREEFVKSDSKSKMFLDRRTKELLQRYYIVHRILDHHPHVPHVQIHRFDQYWCFILVINQANRTAKPFLKQHHHHNHRSVNAWVNLERDEGGICCSLRLWKSPGTARFAWVIPYTSLSVTAIMMSIKCDNTMIARRSSSSQSVSIQMSTADVKKERKKEA